MKKGYIVALLVISCAMGFTVWAFTSSIAPYVTISVAKQSNSPVQLRGRILREAGKMPAYDMKQNALVFWIEDANKERVQVVYRGQKPEAFDSAPETAAHGILRNGVFYSDKLIVKCPSKYEGDTSPYETKPKSAQTSGGSY
jgi:cytochrome c-type biogenesis protein CcmE